MTRLSNCSKAIISISKVEGYLLNFEHCEGKTKAMFFRKFGYSMANSWEFRRALTKLACESLVVQIDERHPFGTRLTAEGSLEHLMQEIRKCVSVGFLMQMILKVFRD